MIPLTSSTAGNVSAGRDLLSKLNLCNMLRLLIWLYAELTWKTHLVPITATIEYYFAP